MAGLGSVPSVHMIAHPIHVLAPGDLIRSSEGPRFPGVNMVHISNALIGVKILKALVSTSLNTTLNPRTEAIRVPGEPLGLG